MRGRQDSRLLCASCCCPAWRPRSRPERSSARWLDTGGLVLPGVTVEARSDVLPTPRVTTTGGAGEYPAAGPAAGHVHRLSSPSPA